MKINQIKPTKNMKTIETKVYSFNELNNEAIQNNKQSNLTVKKSNKEGLVACLILSIIPATLYTLNALHILNLSGV